MSDFDFSEQDDAREALTKVESAQVLVNNYRSNIGALQNRMFPTQTSLDVAIENLSGANSRIRDTDVASSAAAMAKNSILLNASTSVLAQANQSPSLALQLLQ